MLLAEEGPVQFRDKLSYENFIVGAFPQSLAYGGGGVVDPNLSASQVLVATEVVIGEGRFALVDTTDDERMLFSQEFIGALLTLARKVAIGEVS